MKQPSKLQLFFFSSPKQLCDFGLVSLRFHFLMCKISKCITPTCLPNLLLVILHDSSQSSFSLGGYWWLHGRRGLFLCILHQNPVAFHWSYLLVSLSLSWEHEPLGGRDQAIVHHCVAHSGRQKRKMTRMQAEFISHVWT